jgi:hypothetical protein
MSPPSSPSFTPPLSLYLLFHPDCAESVALADRLFAWFRLHDEDGDGIEAGLPVWYRCHPRPLDGSGGPPRLWPPVELAGAGLNAVVVLGSDRLVGDPDWHTAIENDLLIGNNMESRPGVLLLPVAVDESLHRLHFLLQHHQSIRIGRPRPETPESEDDRRNRLDERARLLRRQVMEITARHLREANARARQPEAEARPLPPITAFISHAKRDGRVVAERIRDQLARHSQMRPWYDANELPPGAAWAHPMEQAAREGTAALLSVVSDAYATRYWCRREVRLARTPHAVPGTEHRVWSQQPAVGVLKPGTVQRHPMVQLNRVPHLSWPHPVAAEELPDSTPTEAIARVRAGQREEAVVADAVDRLLLEVLLSNFYEHTCRELAKNSDEQTILLSFVPNPWSLVRTLGEWRHRTGRAALPACIAYPGTGLPSAELIELEETLDDLAPPGDERRPVLVTLEELWATQGRVEAPEAPAPAPPRVAALSAGGTLAGMAPQGVGPAHGNDLLLRITRVLLRDGWHLSYGGTLNNTAHNTTQALLQVARAWSSEADQRRDEAARRAARRPDARPAPATVATAAQLQAPPLRNYVAWPFTRYVTERVRADHVGICRFTDVPPPQAPDSGRSEAQWRADLEAVPTGSPRERRLTAQALRRMRELSSEEAHLRVILGGKLRHWSGGLPGIAEELLASLSRPRDRLSDPRGHAQPVILLGGFGGCAAALAEVLARPDAPWPDVLTAEVPNDKGLPDRARFETLRAAVLAFRARLHDDTAGPLFPTAPALDRPRFFALLWEGSPSAVVRQVREVARSVTV